MRARARVRVFVCVRACMCVCVCFERTWWRRTWEVWECVRESDVATEKENCSGLHREEITHSGIYGFRHQARARGGARRSERTMTRVWMFT